MCYPAQLFSVFFLLSLLILHSNAADYTYEIDCNNLRMGQYICPHPDYDFIDQKTQQPKGCTKENKARGKFIYIFIYLIIIYIYYLYLSLVSITVLNFAKYNFIFIDLFLKYSLLPYTL